MAFTSASLFALPVTKVSGRTAPPERFIFTATKENTKQKKKRPKKEERNQSTIWTHSQTWQASMLSVHVGQTGLNVGTAVWEEYAAITTSFFSNILY
jgi:hypothetical protein